MKRKIFVLVIIVLIVSGELAYLKWFRYMQPAVPAGVDFASLTEGRLDSSGISSPTQQSLPSEAVPAELNIKMEFFPQAPFGSWDMPWQEACEEASVLLVANTYFKHHWTREQFNEQILKLVAWEKSQFGSYEHTSVAQTTLMLDQYLGLTSVVHSNVSFDSVRSILARGHLVVMTFAGKKLKNPYYTNGGPNYHAMVIKGYTADGKIITADVGTKRGENYVYDWDTIQNSLHDYAEPIEKGEKLFIEILPPPTNN